MISGTIGCFNTLIFLFEDSDYVWGTEIIHPIPNYDYLDRPHKGTLTYEIFLKGVTFDDFRMAAEKLIKLQTHDHNS